MGGGSTFLRRCGTVVSMWVRGWIGAGAIAAVAACGGGTSHSTAEDAGHGDAGDAAGPQVTTNGSRLHARWQVAGSVRRLVGWHDATLNIDCDFDKYVYRHEHRCLPTALAQTGVYFSDSMCSTPLINVDPSLNEQYLLTAPFDSCNAEPTLNALGTQVASTAVFAKMANGECGPTSTAFAVFELGKSVPTSTFVAATEQPDGQGQLWLVGEDGSRGPWGGWDGTRAVEPAHIADGSVHWAPWMVAYQDELAGAFADAACTQPVAAKEGPSARCPLDGVLEFIPQSCGGELASFYAAGPQLQTIYEMQNGTCAAQPVAATELAFGIGAPLTLLEVGSVTQGTGPVQLRLPTLGGHPVLQTGLDLQYGGNGPPGPDQFVDVASGADCDAQPATDGKSRCLPTYQTDNIVYSDAACTAALLLLSTTSCTTTPVAPPPFVTTPDAATHQIHVFPVGAQVMPAQLWVQSGPPASCTASSVQSGTAYYSLGPEVAPSRFAEVTVVTE